MFYFLNSGKDTDSSAVEEEDEVRALEAKLRCMAQKKKPSQGQEYIRFALFLHNFLDYIYH